MWKLPLFDAIKAQISADRVIPQPTKSVSGRLPRRQRRLQLCGVEGDQRVRHRHSGAALGVEGRRRRQQLRPRLRNSKKFGLTPRKAARVATPLVAECFANLECANLECNVVDTRLVNSFSRW
jgi:hypothetical protein